MDQCYGQGEGKKLTGAAQYWLRGSVQDDTQDDAKAFGIVLPEVKSEDDNYEVWEEHWDAVMVFLRCQTQWRMGGMGGPVGLDYGAVEWVIRLYEISEPRAVLEDLQVIEGAVLAGLSRKGS